jgi:hypothetical protein
MHGVDLLSMEATDMIDVIHYLFEQDTIFVSEEQMRSHSGVRVAIYETLYGVPYKYKVPDKKTGNQRAYVAEDMETLSTEESRDIKPFNPKEQPTKPFTPATTFDPEAANPFGGLDSPMR